MFPFSFSFLFFSFQLCQPSPRTRCGQGKTLSCASYPTFQAAENVPAPHNSYCWHSQSMLLTQITLSAHLLILRSHDIVERTQPASLEAWVLVPAPLTMTLLCDLGKSLLFSGSQFSHLYWKEWLERRQQKSRVWSLEQEQGSNPSSAACSCMTWDKPLHYALF